MCSAGHPEAQSLHAHPQWGGPEDGKPRATDEELGYSEAKSRLGSAHTATQEAAVLSMDMMPFLCSCLG